MSTKATFAIPQPASDHCTAAFVMSGICKSGVLPLVATWETGFIELVQEAVKYVPVIERMFARASKVIGDNWAGVFDYEVSEEFGAWFGGAIREKGLPPVEDSITRIKQLVGSLAIKSEDADSADIWAALEIADFVAPPRALVEFVDGLAELGFDSDDSISGADTVDFVARHFDNLWTLSRA